MKLISLLVLLSFLIRFQVFAQSESDWLFDDSSLPEIHITIDPDDLNSILTNTLSDTEYPAEFVFIREEVADTIKNIGFRIRGNTSRFSKKKSFKISFDTFIDGREYRGLDKMNINGEHNDPSIIRSKLAWEVFKALEVPSPRANHVRLYINDEYFGLYINVEHIDNEFVKNRFGSDTGNLFKALYPADLTFLGNNPNDYKLSENGRRIYELKINEEEDDYSDIANLIKFLHESSDEEFNNEIHDYINVDGVIRVMAVDIVTGMWDNYMFNKNNFYLYNNPKTNRFELIPYDYDNTFGIDWFGINWAVRDINNWGTNESRPLTDRLFNIPEYKKRLNFYIEKLLDEHFNNAVMIPEIDRLKVMIQQAAEEDAYRTLDYDYTIEDFNRSFDFPLDRHVKSGIKGYLSNRHNTARTQLLDYDIHPVIQEASVELSYTDSGAIITVKTKAFDDNAFNVTAYFEGLINTSFPMRDNGKNGDRISGDGIFTAVLEIDNHSSISRIYIIAEDELSQMDRYPNNPTKFIDVDFAARGENLIINEFMASNNSIIEDENGAFEDWVEIFNPTPSPIFMNDYFLTDDLENPLKWAFPDTIIQPQSYLLVWTDDDQEEGPLHTSFKLNRSGEEIGLYYQSGGDIETIDAFSFGEQITDVSYGRQTDGNSVFISFANPTPGQSNGINTSLDFEESEYPLSIKLFQNYPNPFNPSTSISFTLSRSNSISLNVYSSTGALIQTIANGKYPSGTHTFAFNASFFASGVYFYILETETGEIASKKMLLLK